MDIELDTVVEAFTEAVDAWNAGEEEVRTCARRLADARGADDELFRRLLQSRDRREAAQRQLAVSVTRWIGMGGGLELVDPPGKDVRAPSPAVAHPLPPASPPVPAERTSPERPAPAAAAPLPVRETSPEPSAVARNPPARASGEALGRTHPEPPPSATPPAAAPPAPPASREALERLARTGVGGAVPSPGRSPLEIGHAHLASLLDAMKGRLTEGALGRVRAWWRDVDQLLALPRRDQRQSLELLTARLRGLQERTFGAPVDDLFPLLSAWSRRHEPGSVYGLRQSDVPRHGGWDADADRILAGRFAVGAARPARNPERALEALDSCDLQALDPAPLRQAVLRALKDGLAPDDPRLLRRLEGRYAHLKGERKLSRVRKALLRKGKDMGSPARDPDVPPDWAHRGLTEGRVAVIVGGVQKVDARERLKHAFGFGRLEWVDADPHTLDSLASRLDSGSVDLVVITRYGGHIIDQKLIQGDIRDDLSRWVRIESYGATAVRLAMERQWRGLADPDARAEA